MENIIEEIHALVMEAQTEKAIKRLSYILKLANSKLAKDIISISARFEVLKSDIRKGIIDLEQRNIQHNRIVDAILSLIEDLREDPAIIEQYKEVDAKLDKATEDRSLVLSIEVKDTLYERLANVSEKNIAFRILWIDDFPRNNYYEKQILEQIGLKVDLAVTSEDALTMIRRKEYDLLLSDIRRGDNPKEGIEFLARLILKGIDIPLIFYTGNVDRSKGVPPYAFGIADIPSDLFHLIVDVIQRK